MKGQRILMLNKGGGINRSIIDVSYLDFCLILPIMLTVDVYEKI